MLARQRAPWMYFTGGIAVAVILIVVAAGAWNAGRSTLLGAQGASPLRSGTEVGDALTVQNSFRKIFEMNRDRVVFISTEQTVKIERNPFFNDPFFGDFFGRQPGPKNRTQKRTGLGTGFVISEDGYICTNHHVVAGVDRVKVKVKNRTYDATVVGSDERTDIALLKIDPKEKLEPVYFGDSDSVKVGDWAIAIGNPFGLDHTFTVGVVSATGRRDVEMMGGTLSHIQTDASINPGNSGGPLINIYGEVIGINRMIYSQTGGNMGIGFAIPVNNARAILQELKLHKKIKRGYLGVQVVPLSEEYAREIGLTGTEGALVGGIMDGSPAQKGGLQVGDVIRQIDDRTVKNFGDIVEIVEKTPLGKTLKITVWRNRATLTLFITVKERP